MLQAPLRPPPRPVPRTIKCIKEIIKEILEGKDKKRTAPPPISYSSSVQAMKEGVGRKHGRSPSSAPSSLASSPLSSSLSLRSRSCHTDASLCASSAAATGTRRPPHIRGREEVQGCWHIGVDSVNWI